MCVGTIRCTNSWFHERVEDFPAQKLRGLDSTQEARGQGKWCSVRVIQYRGSPGAEARQKSGRQMVLKVPHLRGGKSTSASRDLVSIHYL